MSEQFDSEGAFFGSRWKELSPSYKAWKDANYPGKKILSLEGPLRKAATSPRRRVTPTLLELTIEPYKHKSRSGGTRTLAPTWFQEGTANMDARPLIFEHLPATAQAEVEAAGIAYAREVLHASGFTPA